MEAGPVDRRAGQPQPADRVEQRGEVVGVGARVPHGRHGLGRPQAGQPGQAAEGVPGTQLREDHVLLGQERGRLGEPDRLAHVPHPVRRVGDLPRDDRAAGQVAQVGALGLVVGDPAGVLGELVEHRVEQGGVVAAGDPQRPAVDALAGQPLAQRPDRLRVAGEHAQLRGVDGGQRDPVVQQRGHRRLGQAHREHRPRRGPPDQRAPGADQAQRVGQREDPGQAGGHVLAEAVPHHQVRGHAPGEQRPGERVPGDEERGLDQPRLREQPLGLRVAVGRGAEHGTQVEPQVVADQVGALVHHGPVGRLRAVEAGAHRHVLGAVAREGEHQRPPAPGVGGGELALRRVEGGQRVGPVRRDEEPPVGHRLAAAQAGRDVGEVHLRPPVEPVAEPAGLPLQRLRRTGRHDEQVRPGGRFGRRLHRCDRRLLQHHVGVGAAHAERADPGPARAVGGPRAGAVVEVERAAREVDRRVGPAHVDGRGQRTAVQRQDRLDETGHPGGGVGVPDVGLHRAEGAEAAVVGAAPERLGQRGDLDGVAEAGARPVRLHVAHRAGVHAGRGQRAADHLDLTGDARRRVAGAACPVVVDGRTADHRVDGVAVRDRVLQPLERDDADPAGFDAAARVRAERAAVPVGGVDPAVVVEVAAPLRREDADPAGQDQVGLAGQQALPAEVHGHQRGRAGGGDGDRGAGEVELVGDPAQQEVLVVADRELVLADGAGQLGVAAQVVEQVAAATRPGEEADPAGIPGRVVTGVLQRVPGALQQQPVLRVEGLRLPGRDPEEGRVELVDPGQPGAGPDVRRVVEPGGIRAVGEHLLDTELPDRLHPGADVVPVLVDGPCAGEAAGHADDGDQAARLPGAVVRADAGPGGRGRRGGRRGRRGGGGGEERGQGVDRGVPEQVGDGDHVAEPVAQSFEDGQQPEGGGHQIGRQVGGERRPQGREVGLRPARQVGDESRVVGVVPAQPHRHVGVRQAAPDGRLDLAEFHPVAAQLDLVVGAAQVFEVPVGAQADEVAGAVQPRAGDARERVRHEPLGRQRRLVQVAACHAGPAHVQLADHARRDRVLPPVQHVQLGVGDRPADGYGAVGGRGRVDLVSGAADHGLRRPVLVDQRGAGRVGPPRRHLVGAQVLAADHEAAGAVGQLGGAELVADQVELGRGDLDQSERGPLLAQRLAQRLRAEVLADHPHGGPADQRHQQARDGQVEADRRVQRQGVAGPQPVGLGRPAHVVAHAAVGDHDALGAAGGAGGVDDVGQVLRRRLRPASGPAPGPAAGAPPGLGGRDRRVRAGHQQRHAVGHEVRQLGAGEHDRGRGVRDQVPQPGRRIGRIQGYVGRAGPQHGEHRHRERDRARQEHPHEAADADAPPAQRLRQRLGAQVQLVVAQRGVAVGHRHAGRGLPRLPLDQQVDQVVRLGGGGGAVPLADELPVLVGGEHRGGADRCARLGHQRPQQRLEVAGEAGHRVGLEQVGPVLQRGPQAVGVLPDRDREVELGGVDGHLDRGDLKVVQARGRRLAAVHEHHLEQRGEAGAAGRTQRLDHAREGQFLPAQGRQGGGPHPPEQRLERRVVVQPGPDGDGVQQQPDEPLRVGPPPVGHRRAHHDVALPRPAGQQHVQRGQHDHVRGDPHPVAQRRQRLGGDVQRHRQGGPRAGRHVGARAAGGQFQHGRRAREFRTPLVELGRRLRTVEPVPLPERVVAAVDVDRVEVRRPPRAVCGVEPFPLVVEDAERPLVDRDVVEGQQEDVLLRRAAQQEGAQHRAAFQVDRGARLGVRPGPQLLVALPGGQPAQVVHPQEPRAWLVDHLDQPPRVAVGRAVRGRRQGGAQGGVPGHQPVERRRQGRHVQRAVQPVRQRHQVAGRPGVEAAELPHLVLCGRGRSRGGARRIVPRRCVRRGPPGPQDVGHRVRLLCSRAGPGSAAHAPSRSAICS
ncbi:hypothetical protein B0E53_03641 [Micromonospora sp. MH33]|nr:hypothetical protein B0E53_03641 [Micromonospora sp. MH33]